MKRIKQLLKQEKGSITMTVVAAMLFITSSILIAYFSLSNQSNDQSKKIRQIADSYKVTNSQLVQEYKNTQNELNSITTMTFEEAIELQNYMNFKQTNTIVSDKNGNTFIVPAEFKVINDANDVDKGIVVRDEAGNEFVWIPVSSDDLNKMYGYSDSGWTILGTDVITNYMTIDATLKNRTLGRTYPSIYDSPYHREPGVNGDSSYDGNPNNRKDAGFIKNDGSTCSLVEMVTIIRDDYKATRDSIKKYKGFYVGRYELGKDSSNNPQVKPGKSMANTSWYKLYNACNAFSNNSVASKMIFECQWDQVCRFIYEKGDKVDLDDSRTYGNYKDSQSPANVTGAGGIQNTGYSNTWKTNNIYDLAGNCWEWTQGVAGGGSNRAARGR